MKERMKIPSTNKDKSLVEEADFVDTVYTS